jgi:Xaa-Pro aminopeptidase
MKTHSDPYRRSPAPDTREKLERVRSFLETKGFSAMILGRRDNFAWLTGGGDSTVVRSSERGFALLVVTRDRLHLVAQTMDGPRILEEEMLGIPAQPAFLRWHDESREKKALALAGGGRIAADFPLEGAEALPGEIARLHYPLTGPDMERCRAIGAASEAIIAGVAAALRPGMTEREVEAMFLGEYARAGMACDVLLVGTDERIARFRHPVPTARKIGRFVLLHPAVQCGGLHANVTRMVWFGDRVPEDIARKYTAACRIAAAAISLSTPGRSFASILEVQKKLYASQGFPEEWHNHFQGGITGYQLADPTLCMDPEAVVSANQAFDWFVTITGVKVEELSLAGPRGHEVPSVSGKWPTTTYMHDGQGVALPDILVQ